MPIAVTRTRLSPAAGTGAGSSATRRSATACSRAAFIHLSFHAGRAGQSDDKSRGVAATLAGVTDVRAQRLEIDGRPAAVEDIWAIDLSPRGHFTAMQVRGGATLGLDF